MDNKEKTVEELEGELFTNCGDRGCKKCGGVSLMNPLCQCENPVGVPYGSFMEKCKTCDRVMCGCVPTKKRRTRIEFIRKKKDGM